MIENGVPYYLLNSARPIAFSSCTCRNFSFSCDCRVLKNSISSWSKAFGGATCDEEYNEYKSHKPIQPSNLIPKQFESLLSPVHTKWIMFFFPFGILLVPLLLQTVIEWSTIHKLLVLQSDFTIFTNPLLFCRFLSK